MQLLQAIQQQSKKLPVGVPLKTQTDNEQSNTQGRDW